jgi:hypothetical protein
MNIATLISRRNFAQSRFDYKYVLQQDAARYLQAGWKFCSTLGEEFIVLVREKR